MKKIITVLALVISTLAVAQESSKWTVGVGVNVIDNSSTADGVFFQSKDWNILPVISKFSIGYEVKENLTVAGEIALNKYSSNNQHNGSYDLASDVSFVGIDLNAKYNVDHFFTDSKKFDASVIGGFGSFWVDGVSNQSLNPGLALDFWLGEDYGIRLQTLGRVAFDNEKFGNNHIQHSIEFILKF